MDVVIVGAGIMGCAVAWELARAGVRVTVLEKAIPGAEASSAAGGILAPLCEAPEDGPLRELGIASLDRYPDWVSRLENESGSDVGFRRCGVLHVALDDSGLGEHDRMFRQLRGLPCERMDGERARTRWSWLSPRTRDALWFPTQATVDNAALVRALHVAAERAGARFVTNQVVDRLPTAEQVVLCAGAWTSALGAPTTHLGIRPIRGQMLAVRGPVLDTVTFVAGRGYLVPRLDGRVLVGSTMEDVGFEKVVTSDGLHALTGLLADVAPGWSTSTVVDVWAGFRPRTADGLPAIGALGPGLWVASGHHRNGILLTPITAEILVAQMLGRPLRLPVSAFDPRRLAGGS